MTAAKKITRYPIISEYSVGYCVQFWLRKPPSQKALSWSARKNENVIDRMPMRRRTAPWA